MFLCLHLVFFFHKRSVIIDNRPQTELLVLISANLFFGEKNTICLAFFWNKLMTWYT